MKASANGHIELTSYLLRHGCEVGRSNREGETALHLAAYGGHYLLCDLLINFGATINPPTGEGETPLFYAARKGHENCIRLLLAVRCVFCLFL